MIDISTYLSRFVPVYQFVFLTWLVHFLKCCLIWVADTSGKFVIAINRIGVTITPHNSSSSNNSSSNSSGSPAWWRGGRRWRRPAAGTRRGSPGWSRGQGRGPPLDTIIIIIKKVILVVSLEGGILLNVTDGRGQPEWHGFGLLQNAQNRFMVFKFCTAKM